MNWFDGPMYGKRGAPRNRTLLGWGIASQRAESERWAKMSSAERRQRRKEWQTPAHRRWLGERARTLAEMTEGVPSTDDQRRYGTGPFGRLTLGTFAKLTFRVKD